MALPTRGDLWWADLDDAGARPVVVVGRGAATRRVCAALGVAADCSS